MRSHFRPAVVCFLLLTLITGVVYPALVTLIAKLAFPHEAQGSLILKDGKSLGSELIGQQFTDPKYFWPRPSATSPVPYAADAGAGSNLGPSNPALLEVVKQRVVAMQVADAGNAQPIPIELVAASASGLDPHISLQAVEYQIGRVAHVRQVNQNEVRKLVEQFTERRVFGVLGEPRVNVLKLNLALDGR